jgi:triacylglycerol lipase
MLDSPAYGNLSTAYLNDVFNPRTPDDPRVRYFSVGGRSPTVNIWHPLWLPKMVLDSWEAKERARQKEATGAARSPISPASAFPVGGAIRGPIPGGPPLWALDEEWGNDGLVTVQSAKWGTYLGTLEGCDHWEIRGARGLELDIDGSMLSSLANSMPGVSLKDWDWSGFLGAWRLSGDARKADAVRVNVDTKSGTIEAGTGANGKQKTDGQSSMETLSAVFDWVAEHVPTEAVTKLTSRVSDVVGANSTLEEVEAAAQGTNRKGERNELATKEDLERFYVALSRNLYNEGL